MSLWPRDLTDRAEFLERYDAEARRFFDAHHTPEQGAVEAGPRAHTLPSGAAPTTSQLRDKALQLLERAAVCLANAAEIAEESERQALRRRVHALRILRREVMTDD